MSTNDFFSVTAVLSNERIRGAGKSAQMNTEYPCNGPWRFRINRLIASHNEVVTHVSVDDGVQHAEAISFFSVSEGKIARMFEYWPDAYAAPANRRHVTEPMR
jgi:hypothetical protein